MTIISPFSPRVMPVHSKLRRMRRRMNVEDSASSESEDVPEILVPLSSPSSMSSVISAEEWRWKNKMENPLHGSKLECGLD